jgi:hypothetical protein
MHWQTTFLQRELIHALEADGGVIYTVLWWHVDVRLADLVRDAVSAAFCTARCRVARSSNVRRLAVVNTTSVGAFGFTLGVKLD